MPGLEVCLRPRVLCKRRPSRLFGHLVSLDEPENGLGMFGMFEVVVTISDCIRGMRVQHGFIYAQGLNGRFSKRMESFKEGS